jgi:hypothetical protein
MPYLRLPRPMLASPYGAISSSPHARDVHLEDDARSLLEADDRGRGAA